MYAQFYFLRLAVLLVTGFGTAYLITLWVYALIRTKLRFLGWFIVANAGGLVITILSAAYAYNLAAMKRVDPSNILYGLFLASEPIVLLISITAQTTLVRWILDRAKPLDDHSRASSERRQA
jgi:uncharacterized membrane protein